MPLHIFLAAALAGCGLIAAYAHWLGRSVRRRLTDTEEAGHLFETACPEHEVHEVLVSGDGHAALVTLKEGGIGLIYAMGSKWMARNLPAGSAKSLKRLDENRLRLTLGDYTMPRLTFTLANEAEAARWTALLDTILYTNEAGISREAAA